MLTRYGLISSDSHVCVDRDAFTKRMSSHAWGDRIPEVREVEDDGKLVERWVVDGRVASRRGVSNCAAVMNDPLRRTYPQRWEEVPRCAYIPEERLAALDEDGVDAEVLFFNDPIDSANIPFIASDDAAYELACVQAYNDALAEWRAASERFVPLAIIPYLSDIQTVVNEVQRSIKNGLRGVVMVAEPSMSGHRIKHFNDPWWDPLWAACQDLDVPINWHAHAGIKLLPPSWQQFQAIRRTAAFSVQPQFIANLLFSGISDRFPRLKWVCAETGIGWLAYVLQSCDFYWERYRLWREGMLSRPSEVFRRQVYANFWYEQAGVEMRHFLGVDRLMWASDYPHGTSTYPDSWKLVNAVLGDTPAEERALLLYRNAEQVYGLA